MTRLFSYKNEGRMRRQPSMCGATYPGQAGSLAGGSGVAARWFGVRGRWGAENLANHRPVTTQPQCRDFPLTMLILREMVLLIVKNKRKLLGFSPTLVSLLVTIWSIPQKGNGPDSFIPSVLPQASWWRHLGAGQQRRLLLCLSPHEVAGPRSLNGEGCLLSCLCCWWVAQHLTRGEHQRTLCWTSKFTESKSSSPWGFQADFECWLALEWIKSVCSAEQHSFGWVSFVVFV